MRIAGWVALSGAALLALVCGGATAAAQSPPAQRVALDVPFLPQTEDLCGGAATAMLFRFWGDRHASVRQFEALVDRTAGGIADSVLIDAIEQRQWSVHRLPGSVEAIRAELDAGRPPMLLIEDRPGRYHYVVAVGADAAHVFLHDPTWGPARKVPIGTLTHAWRPTNFWMIRVVPQAGTPRVQSSTAQPQAPAATAPAREASSCDQRVDRALDAIEASGLERADELLLPLTRECPDAAAPWRELAGVRFAQRRWDDASALASEALARDPHDRYAADVLGSSRFMRNDFDGALRAWNRIDKPTLDSIRITGLTRTRYALLADALGLREQQVLTAEAFRLARRRLESLPDLSSTRLSLRPDEDHFAVADIAVVERGTLPRGPIQWAATAAQAGLERSLSISVPGRTGQGETWSAGVGWWERRPRVDLTFAAPVTTGLRGVWRVGASWAAQVYGGPAVARREEQLGGSISFSTWLSPNLQADIRSGVDRWTSEGDQGRRMVHVRGLIERRFSNDRVAASASAARYIGTNSFGLFDASVLARTSREPKPLVLLVRGGVTHAGPGAPLALWSGAGEGRSRGPLLRAHRLLHDGRIDGPVFGRTLMHATLEAQHWFDRPHLVRLGAAAFADAARAGSRPDWATAPGVQVDIGLGVRVRVPGRSGAFRVDYAYGTRDGARAWFIGWQID
ncbi:MAG: C39 family peptidase [Acidobacteria bacterium]|nr:C39 family peptidase [Acidobacteriota bacterium]